MVTSKQQNNCSPNNVLKCLVWQFVLLVVWPDIASCRRRFTPASRSCLGRFSVLACVCETAEPTPQASPRFISLPNPSQYPPHSSQLSFSLPRLPTDPSLAPPLIVSTPRAFPSPQSSPFSPSLLFSSVLFLSLP